MRPSFDILFLRSKHLLSNVIFITGEKKIVSMHLHPSNITHFPPVTYLHPFNAGTVRHYIYI